MTRSGILASGNWIIDQVKVIDSYPDEEQLSNILHEYSSNGGSAYNVLKGLAKLNVKFPLSALGLVGEDERGRGIITECERLNINTTQLQKTFSSHTSYTDVMSIKQTGKRTFFHQRGANAFLDTSHFDFEITEAKIFHLGYLLLLDKLDIVGADGMTGAAQIFRKAKEHGLITSADLVSERSERFKQVIPCALPYIDYLFVNEFEAGMLSGIKTTNSSGEIVPEQCVNAASKILEMGVQQSVILHFPAGAIAISKQGSKNFQSSINILPGDIKGAVGAGDAFAAGVLMGVHENLSMDDCLKIGVCAAASSLFDVTSSEGILPFADCLLLADKYGYR
jgi:sugar/nucleoside kinase (ribokinase family)